MAVLAKRLAPGQTPPSGAERRLVVLLPSAKPPRWLLDAVNAQVAKHHSRWHEEAGESFHVPKPGVAFYYSGDWSGWSFWW